MRNLDSPESGTQPHWAHKKNTTDDRQQHENVMTWLHIMAVKRPNTPAMQLGGYKSPMRETSGQSALSFN